jgi:hypothetical protein
MTSTEIRNSYKEFQRMMESFDYRVANTKNGAQLAQISAEFQSCFNLKTLEIQVEIAAQLAEISLNLGIAATKLTDIADIARDLELH